MKSECIMKGPCLMPGPTPLDSLVKRDLPHRWRYTTVNNRCHVISKIYICGY